MSLCNTKSTKSEEFSRRQTRSSRPILIDCNVVPEEEVEEEDEEEEEEEEEDVDFNPFLKETSSPEASSSLSSDDDEGNVEETNLPSLNSIDEVQDGKEGKEEEEEEEEEVPVQSVMERPRKRKSVENNASTSGVDVVEDGNNEVRNETTDSDDEDAICRRTRARYSLANFSLDELETFLQETDDDEDLKHVDDEEEYRKFLAAVLQDGESEGQAVPENGNVYDDDEEDYDADFDAELEEALDSDPDEGMGEKMNEDFDEGRRPKTRQNNRKQKKLLGQVNRPLRPLVPLPAFPGICPPRVLLDRTINCPPPTEAGLVNGFTAHQIGQLHCLIHEHTQLLVQIYSLSVLDSTRQHIAAETRKLMSELVYTRDNVLSWRKVAYPDYCFRPPYIHPSISGEVPKFHPLHVPVDLSSPARQKEMPAPHSVCSLGRCNDGGQVDSLRTNRNSMWVPQVSSPVLSILDAAPLSLVGTYMADVSRAVREYRKRHLEGLFDTHFEKKPMYPLFNIPPSHEANGEALKRTTSQGPTTISPSLAAPQPPKKTLAAALVESTKTQSVAFAPEEVVALSQRFYPLFNTALYPRKPPLAAVANRVLFTDTEDELLAMGMMEYNTDWKAIQQRFLPCKSKHQIFVRQKNRCSAKAPENPIKAVRQMKTSPLTEEEKACIHKGLKVFKLDWMSVWKFIVPYRDPSLLPRQWRVATGTQKSYKSDAAKREKRHLYLAQKRLSKAPALVNWQPVPENEDNVDHNAAEGNISENDNMEDEDEAYVHEAFLADWTPRNSRSASSDCTLASVSRRDSQPGVLVSREDSCANQIPVSDWYGGLHPGNHAFLSSNFPQHYQNVSHFSHVRYSASYTVASNHFGPDCLSKSSKSQVSLRPHRVRRKKDAQSVKLAPDLPPVNLPPSVRVVSQSAFKSYHCVAPHSIKVSSSGAETESLVPRLAEVAKSGKTVSANSGSKVSAPHSTPRDQRVPVDRPAAENLVPRLAEVAKSGKTVSVNSRSKVSAPSSHSTPQGPRAHSDRAATEDRNAGMDLQMHPLLLQAPEDGRLPYCPVNSSTSASGTFNFIAGNQLHSNFGHFCKPSDAGSIADGFYSSLSLKNSSRSCAIDFHPLLQRKDDGNLAQLRNSSGSVMTEPHVPSGPKRIAPVPASPNEMAHDLDLEIHLSSTSRKEKVTTCRKVTEHHSNGSRNGLLNIGIRKETNRTMNLSQERSENCPTTSIPASSGNQGHVLGNRTLLLPNNTSRCTEDHVGDKPPPGIVMEQEELSDSEEEKGEDVEFECEEMDDSDREESDRE